MIVVHSSISSSEMPPNKPSDQPDLTPSVTKPYVRLITTRNAACPTCACAHQALSTCGTPCPNRSHCARVTPAANRFAIRFSVRRAHFHSMCQSGHSSDIHVPCALPCWAAAPRCVCLPRIHKDGGRVELSLRSVESRFQRPQTQFH